MSAWESFMARYGVGDVLSGRVTQVMPFGAFVEVAEGVVGLFRPDASVPAPEVGASVSARIAAVDGEKQRVALVPA
jgi:ribosomal protein S1